MYDVNRCCARLRPHGDFGVAVHAVFAHTDGLPFVASGVGNVGQGSGAAAERYAVFQLRWVEVERVTIDGDVAELRVVGLFHRKVDGVGARRAVLRFCDDARCAVHTIGDDGRLALVTVAFGAGDGGQCRCADGQFVRVTEGVFFKVRQQHAVEIDGFQGRNRRFGGGEHNFVGAFCAACCRYNDLVCAFDAADAACIGGDGLVVVALFVGYLGQTGCAERQTLVIGRFFSVPILYRYAVEFQAFQVAVGRCSDFERQFVGTRGGVAGGFHGNVVSASATAVGNFHAVAHGDGLRTSRVCRCVGDGGQCRCAERQLYGVVVFGRGESSDGLAAHLYVLQRVVGQFAYRKHNAIGVCCAVGGFHTDGGCACGRGGLRNADGLSVVAFGYAHNWGFGGAVGQFHAIFGDVTVVVRHRGGSAAHRVRNACWAVVRRLLGNKFDFVGRCALAIFRFHSDDHRLAAYRRFRAVDADFAARQYAPRKRNACAAAVGECANATLCKQIGNLRRTQTKRVGLLFAVVFLWVEAAPTAVVYKQFVDIRTINQFYIIYIEVVARIDAAVGTEIGIVARRKNYITLIWHICFACVVNRYFYLRPFRVGFVLFHPTFGHLFGKLAGGTFVAVEGLAYIRFFVGVRGRGATAVFTSVGVAHRCAFPRVEHQVEILFVGVVAGALYPNAHGVGAIFETDAAVATCRGFAHFGDAFEIRPRLPKCHIAGRRFGNASRTNLLVGYIGARTAVATVLFVHKGELEADLRYIRAVPIFQLRIAVERTAPILKS